MVVKWVSYLLLLVGHRFLVYLITVNSLPVSLDRHKERGGFLGNESYGSSIEVALFKI
jgi:hypothetical protein